MRSDQLKKQLYVKLGIFVTIMLLQVFVGTKISSYNERLYNKSEKVKNSSNVLEEKISNFQQRKKYFDNVFKSWELISSTYVGILDVDTLNDLLSDLRIKYQLISLDIKMSPPQNIKLNDKLQHSFSKIELSFEGISDEHLVSFVHSLIEMLPGYVITNSFFMTKSADVDERYIQEIKNGVLTPLVSGGMVFDWGKLIIGGQEL